jgi:hypothetical protein
MSDYAIANDPNRFEGVSTPGRESRKSSRDSGIQPHRDTPREGYGLIYKVNENDSTVQVKLFRDRMGRSLEEHPIRRSENNFDPVWLPVINSLGEIHLLYGKLRKDLVVRVFWVGAFTPFTDQTPVMVQVVSDVGTRFDSKKPKENELQFAAHKFMAGGIVPV